MYSVNCKVTLNVCLVGIGVYGAVVANDVGVTPVVSEVYVACDIKI